MNQCLKGDSPTVYKKTKSSPTQQQLAANRFLQVDPTIKSHQLSNQRLQSTEQNARGLETFPLIQE